MGVNDQLHEYFQTNQDNPMVLDVVLTFYLSLPSKTGYTNHQGTWKLLLGHMTNRNLRLKYRLKAKEASGHMARFLEFRNSLLSSFLSYDDYYDDRLRLRQTIEEFHNTFEAQLEKRLGSPVNLNELEKQVASFTVSYWPLKTYEAAEHEQGFGSAIFDHHSSQKNPFEYELLGEVWTQDFNLIFGADMSYELRKVKIASQQPFFRRFGLGPPFEEHKLWKIGDMLVSLGLAYWTCGVSSKGKTHIDLEVPKSLGQQLPELSVSYSPIPNLSDRLQPLYTGLEESIEKNAWGIDEFIDNEMAQEFQEDQIEQSLIMHPELIEPGLTWYDPSRPNQYPTEVGRIDLLARDEHDNLVVVELKKDRATSEVVGQIQKYLVWSEKILSPGRTVRGIILARSAEKDLEYAVRGSKYPIDIKVFGDAPPVEENLKYCPSCGVSNPKTARYCIRCGKEQWL